MFIADQTYLNWQKWIKQNKFGRWFWRGAGVYVVALLAITCGYLFFTNPKALVLALGALVFARLIVCETVYYFYKKQRPYQRIGFPQLDAKIFLSLANGRPDAMP